MKSRALALFLAFAVLTGPLVPVARASAGPSPTTLEIPGLKRTNQVLSLIIAMLKLIDEIAQLPPGDGGTPMPPPIGTGHPGPLPGPLPVISPDDPPAEFGLATG
jgi:hypothetical protein